jgi:hypothetical protein
MLHNLATDGQAQTSALWTIGSITTLTKFFKYQSLLRW